jgi:hypothetical protein
MLMDYRDYEVTDFIMDEAFFRWVIQPTKSLDECWAAWLEQHPDKREEVAEARWYILRSGELLKSSSAVSNQRMKNLKARINKTLEL